MNDQVIDVQSAPTPEDKAWATAAHASSVFFPLVGPLFVHVMKSERPFVRKHTVEAINFQVTLMVAYAIGIVATIICIGPLLLMAAHAVNIVLSLVAAAAAIQGADYVYPWRLKVME